MSRASSDIRCSWILRGVAGAAPACRRQGAEVIYESIHQIHVSGHGFQDELLMMLNACRPKHFIPVHGEY
ncbi:MAG: MBL fold metallo-hydrolase RNA specificity domain-containing protein, partial [Mycobacteriales bacterium]